MRILVIDDEKDMQRLFEQRFRKERQSGELEFRFVFSAADALSYLELGTDVALILSDINMPEMNGLELLKIIREQYPEQKVCMMTAYSDDTFRQQATMYGANDYLTKPIDFEDLREKILN
ncbi:MAG: response regulator [Saprospiraceae bacterium]|nr:response regulator [Saprospiraceae bacterium]